MSIDPDRLYPFAEAARLIPSARGGHVCLRTLHRWRVARLLDARCRRVRRRAYWFVPGFELLRLVAGEANGEGEGQGASRTEAQARRDRFWADRELERYYPELMRGEGTGGIDAGDGDSVSTAVRAAAAEAAAGGEREDATPPAVHAAASQGGAQ